MSIQKAIISFKRVYEVELNSLDLPDPVTPKVVIEKLIEQARLEFEKEFEFLNASSDNFSAHIVKSDISL